MQATTAVTHQMMKQFFKSMQLRNQGNLEGSLFVLQGIKNDVESLIQHTETEIRQAREQAVP